MLDRVVNLVTEQTTEHQQMLADFAARSEPFADELFDAWNKVCREVLGEPVTLDGTFREFLKALRQANLRGAYAAFGAWGRDAARAGIPFDAALRLLRSGQGALLPFVLRVYSKEPQLPLVLDAIADTFNALVGVIGAAYAEVMPIRCEEGVSLYTIGRLAGGAAHTLNNLLTSILGRTQLLLEQTNDDALRDELEAIRSTAGMGARVVRRIQDFIQANGSVEGQGADVNLALRDAAELTRFLWRDQAEAGGIVVDVVKDFSDVPPAQFGLSALRQVCVALILNAAEALPNGGRITLRTERKDEAILIAVLDNGSGMSEDVRVRLGELFFTTKSAPHLGLGLNSVAQIVAKTKGTWSVESAPRQGTTITLSLPIARRSTGGKIRPMTATRAADILIIDNEPSVRDLLARLLRLHGHIVVTAESGAEGIAAFKAGVFDFVLTDLGMPEMSGWDVALEIKKENPKVLIGLITGWPVDLTREELRERGVDCVVGKPFEMPTLFSLIDDALVRNSKS